MRNASHPNALHLAPRSEGHGEDAEHCVYLDANCAVLDLAQRLGGNILTTFLLFVHSARPGDRLTLQRNRDGFSIQVTQGMRGEQAQHGAGPLATSEALRIGR